VTVAADAQTSELRAREANPVLHIELELVRPEEQQRRVRVHDSVLDRRRRPGQEPPPTAPRNDFDPDHSLTAGVCEDVTDRSDTDAADAHGGTVYVGEPQRAGHEREPSARSSAAFVIRERPRIRFRRASS
jgi:hypothetical protein